MVVFDNDADDIMQVLDPGGRRASPQLALFEELVVRAYLAVSSSHCLNVLHLTRTLDEPDSSTLGQHGSL